MKTIIVNRDEVSPEQAMGVTYVADEACNLIFKAESIERGWLDNKKRVSCIPIGHYTARLEWSNKFKKMLWEIYGVPNRSECKFHAANYSRQLNGCIALGQNRRDIDNDGLKDVTSSKVTMKKFHEALDGEAQVDVIIRNTLENAL